MNFENRTVTLKDGRTCTLRPTCPDDAEVMIEYMKVTAGETQFVLRYPDEVNYTLEQEAELLNGILNDQSSVMMVGIVDGRVAGNCSINGLGNKRKLTHLEINGASGEVFFPCLEGNRLYQESSGR